MKEYVLFGYLNMFNIVPDFVFPVFKAEDYLYIQEGEHDKIEDIKLLDKQLYNAVNELKMFENRIDELKITKNSLPIYAFQKDENTVICGNSSVLLNFFKNYDSEDSILKEEIEDFRNDVSSSEKKYTKVNTIEYLRFAIATYGKAKAKIFLKYGNGKIEINSKDIDNYFTEKRLKSIIMRAFLQNKAASKYDIEASVYGGSLLEQAHALRNGIRLIFSGRRHPGPSQTRESQLLELSSKSIGREIVKRRSNKKSERRKFDNIAEDRLQISDKKAIAIAKDVFNFYKINNYNQCSKTTQIEISDVLRNNGLSAGQVDRIIESFSINKFKL